MYACRLAPLTFSRRHVQRVFCTGWANDVVPGLLGGGSGQLVVWFRQLPILLDNCVRVCEPILSQGFISFKYFRAPLRVRRCVVAQQDERSCPAVRSGARLLAASLYEWCVLEVPLPRLHLVLVTRMAPGEITEQTNPCLF